MSNTKGTRGQAITRKMWFHNICRSQGELYSCEDHTARGMFTLLSAYIGSMMFAQDSCKSGNNCLAGRRRELIVRQNLLTMPVGRLSGAAPCPRYFLPFYSETTGTMVSYRNIRSINIRGPSKRAPFWTRSLQQQIHSRLHLF
jgi:hypothetical protein